MIKNSYCIHAKIWRWPGNGGWHFITLDKKLSMQIRSVYTKGFVPVVATVGKTKWNTSLFPHMPNKKVSKEIEYLLCINKKVLKQEGLFASDEIKVSFMVK